MNNQNIKIRKAGLNNLSEILALQKKAYKSEAQIHNDFSIPPLHQTLENIKQEYEQQVFLEAVNKDQVVGSVRGFEKDGTCFIGKLIVDDDFQNMGLGSRLLTEMEQQFSHCKRFELFTGHKSEKNLYLYQKHGYKAYKTEEISSQLSLVFLEKLLN